MNHGDSAEVIRKYVGQVGVTFPIGMSGMDKKLDVSEKYGVVGYPTSFVVDASGIVVYRGVPSDPSGIRAALEKLGIGRPAKETLSSRAALRP